jgi:hypothetical protein
MGSAQNKNKRPIVYMYGHQKVDLGELRKSFYGEKPRILGDSCDKSSAKRYDTDSCQKKK